MKEIGGYIEWEYYHGKEYHDGLYRFDSVRSSIHCIIKEKGYKKIYIPYYSCDCMENLFKNIGINFEKYNIDEYFLPILNKDIEENECLFIINYFGQLSNQDIKSLTNIYKNIFIDNTQSFFQRQINGVDMANSCRKFLGVTDGSYLNTDLNLADYNDYELDSSLQKLQHLVGRFENNANSYYTHFIQNESLDRGNEIKKMSSFVINVLCSLDYEYIIQQRKSNFTILEKELDKYNQLKIKNYAGLFMYPFLIRKGEYLKKYLISKKIYVPTLWNNVLNEVPLDSWEARLTNDLVLLPIDQRYGQSEMEYVLKVIKENTVTNLYEVQYGKSYTK